MSRLRLSRIKPADVGGAERIPVGFTENELVVLVGADKPPFFVDKPVVKTAEKDEIVQVCFAAFRPVDDVMNLQPVAVPTSVELALPSITMMDETS